MASEGGSVIYKLRDCNQPMVEAWKELFKDYADLVEISQGDIFKDAPGADALVSPANSFGYMDGGIDKAYSLHFGWQMQERLQKIIREEYDGELPVGMAVILPTFGAGDETATAKDWRGFNDHKLIKLLISAPTMRVPCNVATTAHAYQAFRGIILAVKKYNADKTHDPIRTVLCPGLGTMAGQMPPKRCAYQMLRAFEVYELGKHPQLKDPSKLTDVWPDHQQMAGYGKEKKTFGPLK